MNRGAGDLCRALDPVALAADVGMDPDAWQVDVLRSDIRASCSTSPASAARA